jgi:hypothetical protein
MTGLRTFLVLTMAYAAAASPAHAQPRTDIARTPRSQLDFQFHDPQRITVRLAGDTASTTYWYLLYTVTNNTGRDVQFFPSFRLVTNTLEVVDGGSGIHPRVYEYVAARHRDQCPFFEPPLKVSRLLLQGPENARTSAAIFRTFDLEASTFTVFVSGLSDEVDRIANPGFDPKKEESNENQRSFILRRTLAITYDLPGDAKTRSLAAPVRRNREWVMR